MQHIKGYFYPLYQLSSRSSLLRNPMFTRHNLGIVLQLGPIVLKLQNLKSGYLFVSVNFDDFMKKPKVNVFSIHHPHQGRLEWIYTKNH